MFHRCVNCDDIWCNRDKCSNFSVGDQDVCHRTCDRSFDELHFKMKLIEYTICLKCKQRGYSTNARLIDNFFSINGQYRTPTWVNLHKKERDRGD